MFPFSILSFNASFNTYSSLANQSSGIFFNGTGEIIEEGKIIYQTTAEELKNESDDYDYPKLLVAAIKNSRKK